MSCPALLLLHCCSMGGQAAALGSAAACTKKWDIRATALHHPFSGALPNGQNLGTNISVPVIGFTSAGDSIFQMNEDIMKSVTVRPNADRYEVGWSHLEPVLVPPIENPLLVRRLRVHYRHNCEIG